MWIRSQNDYILIKAESIEVLHDNVWACNVSGRARVGTYKTGEELDNVMYMLEKAIKEEVKVFKMPQRGFLEKTIGGKYE